jgi:hypothetical protein
MYFDAATGLLIREEIPRENLTPFPITAITERLTAFRNRFDQQKNR